MKSSISEIDKIKENLKKKGFEKIDKFYDEDLLKKIRSQFEIYYNQNKISKDKKPGLLVNKKLVQYINFPFVISEEAVNLVVNKNIINIAEDYLEAEVKLSYVVAYRTRAVKKALRYYYNTPGVFSGWHSDNQLNAHGHRMLTSMVYLSDVNKENGPVEIVENTFKLGLKKRIFFEEDLENYKKEVITGNFGTILFFDMDAVHKAHVPTHGYRDVVRFSFSPKNGYTEKIYFVAKHIEKDLDSLSKKIIDFDRNKNQYENFKKQSNKFNIKKTYFIIKEKIIYLLCHFEFIAKWYLKRRINILKGK